MIECMVSVVIPIYNVEKYLDRCIQSVVHQTYKNLDIILVDDGSPDSCPFICDEWAKKDSRIKVIHKQNEGLGYARNTGMDHADGEYVFFLDSDDYAEPDLIEKCYAEAKRHAADVVLFGNDFVSEKGDVLGKRIPAPPCLYYAGNDIRKKLIPRLISYSSETGENWQISMSACFALLSMKAIKAADWRFVSEREIISEDFYSMFELYRHVDVVAFVPEALYHYTSNPHSLSRSYRKDRYARIKHFAVSMQALSETMELNVRAEIATLFLGLLMGAIRQIVAANETFAYKLNALREIMNDEYLQNTLRSNNFSGDDLPKKLLYLSLKRKQAVACYFLAWVKNRISPMQ